MDEKIIEQLYLMCSWRKEILGPVWPDYIETIDLAHEKQFDSGLKKELFVELYRYSFYVNGFLGLDPKRVFDTKRRPLLGIKKALNDGSISSAEIKKLKSHNDLFEANINHPTEEIESEIEFRAKHPNVKF